MMVMIITGSDVGLTVIVLVMTKVSGYQVVQPLKEKLSHQLNHCRFFAEVIVGLIKFSRFEE